MPDAAQNTLDLPQVLDRTTVGHVHYLPETDSTNEVALARAAQIPDDTSELVLTSRQLRGKGRGENRWWAGEGALTFSLITPRLPLPTEQTPRLSLVTGLAICQAVEQSVPTGETRLKWPNDVYLNGRKAAGILIESPGVAVGRFVVGVGINVNNRFAEAPPEVQQRAVSLADAAGGPLDLTGVLIDCLRQFDACLAMLLAGDPQLAGLWRAWSLLDGRRVRLALPAEVVEGVCRGIAEDGALLIEQPGGDRACYGGVVEWFE